MLSDIQGIILATGTSKRLLSPTTTLIEKICGQELIVYPITLLQECAIPTIIVKGSHGDTLQRTVEHYTHVQWVEQNGTAHAVALTADQWRMADLLIMAGNIPLLSRSTLENLYATHRATKAAISFIASHYENTNENSYYRVIQKKKKIQLRSVDELSPQERQDHCCINAGIYLISREFLINHIHKLTTDVNLAELINSATATHAKVTMVFAAFDEVRTVDTYQELWTVEQIKRAQLIRYWMERGVRFAAAQNVHLDLNVQIGAGSYIGNGVHLYHGTQIGTNSIIDAFSLISESTIGNNVTVYPHSIIKESTIGDHSQIGPFAHIQSHTIVGEHCALGNFVETKRTTLGNHTKAKHLTYLGDAQIGTHVNIGAGTITCNYDGQKKHTTTIEDNVFIGSNNSLVAPVTIAKEAFTAAGSTITHDVPSQALAIGRARQVNKEGYARKVEAEEPQENSPEPKQSVSFVGATKSSSIDL